MTAGGLIFMILTWAVILILVIFSYGKTIKADKKNDMPHEELK